MSPWRPQGGPAARPLAHRLAFRPQLLPLEERVVPATITTTDPPATTPPATTAPVATTPVADQIYAVGADVGNAPLVQVYNADGSLKYSFMAYDASFRGGVRVAIGDVTGDGVPDIVTAPGPGMPPQIKVFDGTSGAEVANYMAYHENFLGGVYVAVADINGDGHADIITGAGAGGGPHVKIMDGAYVVPPLDSATPPTTPPVPSPLPGAGSAPGVLASFYAYAPNFTGGVRVAAADANGHPEIITGAGPGGGPHVRVYDGVTGQISQSFYAFAPTYTGGVYVTAGDIAGNGDTEVAVGSGSGLQEVKVYDASGNTLRTYGISDPAAALGVRVGMADINGDGKDELLLSVGTSVEVRDPLTNATEQTITPFDPTVLGGVFVG